jgi:TrwC relaxase
VGRQGAAVLGLTGHVDPAVIGRLYQHNIGPTGELLVTRRQSRAAEEREAAAVAAYLAAHPYASATEVAEVRAAERGTDPHLVPYFDLTVDVVKSVSVLHASYRVSAWQARQRGESDQAAVLDARADEIEAALLEAAREAVAWLERHATYTRTGHHSARTAEWRDGDGLVASMFLHHISHRRAVPGSTRPRARAGAGRRDCSAAGTFRNRTRIRKPPPFEPAAANIGAHAPQHEPGDRPARLDALQARADEAVHRIAADNAAREARAQYTGRLEREAPAQAEPAAEYQAEAPGGIEIEL